MEPSEAISGYCHVCGREETVFRSYEPVDFPCKRNSFICDGCQSSARNRHIAKTVLELYPQLGCASLVEFAGCFEGTIFVAAANGSIVNALQPCAGLVTSEYIDGVPSGVHQDGVLSEDIQATSFDADTFDLVITEDVLEHVPYPDRAFAEIRRILKRGGHHVATIPVKWDVALSRPRAVLENGGIVHLLEPEYHLDPTRPEGVLAFTDYGRDIVERYCSIIGPSRMLAAHQDAELEKHFGIYNNWVFISRMD